MKSYTRLPVRRLGPAEAGEAPEPIFLLHGFTQTGESWGPLLPHLMRRHLVVVPDAPGHGAAAAVAATMWETADLLATTAAATSAGPANWVGYSMGGRAALHVALAHPEAVRTLVLISTSAGIEDDVERAARRQRDGALADRIERGGDERLHDFLAEWLSQPLFATLPPERAALEQRLTNTAAGLASSLRSAGAGAQEPLWDRLPELGARGLPVMLIAGELDAKYREYAERMAGAIGPSASVVVVNGAGHACHLEHPDQVAAQISRLCTSAIG